MARSIGSRFYLTLRHGGCFDWSGVFSTGSTFFANNFGSNKGIQSKLSDFPEM